MTGHSVQIDQIHKNKDRQKERQASKTYRESYYLLIFKNFSPYY